LLECKESILWEAYNLETDTVKISFCFPGANSPTQWIEKCVKALSPSKKDRQKFLIGLNFYGYEYTTTGGHPIVGREYLELVAQAKTIQWSEEVEEHYFEVK
jgi:chitinase domain-containing protein 1